MNKIQRAKINRFDYALIIFLMIGLFLFIKVRGILKYLFRMVMNNRYFFQYGR